MYKYIAYTKLPCILVHIHNSSVYSLVFPIMALHTCYYGFCCSCDQKNEVQYKFDYSDLIYIYIRTLNYSDLLQVQQMH